MDVAVKREDSVAELGLASAMLRLSTREERLTTRAHITLKMRIALVIATATEPVEHATLTTRFGYSIGKPLRELEATGHIKHRAGAGLGLGEQREYLPAHVAWPTQCVVAKTAPKKLTKTQATAAAESKKTIQASRQPWPFYDVKFLPYVRFMDAKMKRRYARTAALFGHKVPE